MFWRVFLIISPWHNHICFSHVRSSHPVRMHDAPVPDVPLGCCCRVNIGQTLFLLLFAFDCWIKGVYSLVLANDQPFTKNKSSAQYPKPNIWQRNHYFIFFVPDSTTSSSCHVYLSILRWSVWVLQAGGGRGWGGKWRVYLVDLMRVRDKMKLISYHF